MTLYVHSLMHTAGRSWISRRLARFESRRIPHGIAVASMVFSVRVALNQDARARCRSGKHAHLRQLIRPCASLVCVVTIFRRRFLLVVLCTALCLIDYSRAIAVQQLHDVDRGYHVVDILSLLIRRRREVHADDHELLALLGIGLSEERPTATAR